MHTALRTVLLVALVAPAAAQTKALDPTVGACTRKEEFAARQAELDARIVALTAADDPAEKARLGAEIAEELGHGQRIENLIRYREPDLRHVFVPLLAADHWPIRARALYGLKMVGDSDVVPDVAPALDDPDPRVRELAASCLGHIAVDTAALDARLRDERDAFVRATLEAAIATAGSAMKPYRTWEETLAGPDGARRVEWAWTVKGQSSFNDYDAKTVDTPTAGTFGWPISWYDGSLFAPVPRDSFGAGGNHAGEDMAWFREGASVYAIADGLVRMVQGAGGNWGFLVLVEHRLQDGRYFSALYGHLGFDVLVRPGEVVASGQKLGTVGLSCSVENGGYGAHLHFGLGDNPFRRPQGILRGSRLAFGYEGERVQAPVTHFLYMPDRPDEYGFPGLGVRVQVPDGPSLDLHVGNVKIAQQVSWITGYADGCRGWLDPRAFLAPRIGAEHETLSMRIVAREGDPGVDLPEETRRLRAWLAEHPVAATDPAAILTFHALGADRGGPTSEAVRWFPHVIGPSRVDPGRWQQALSRAGVDSAVPAFDDADWNDGDVPDGRERLLEYVPLRMDGEAFTGADLDPAHVEVGTDELGRPALDYGMRPERAAAYGDWSEAHIGRSAAIVIDGLVISAPRFIARIEGRGRISGEFTEKEVADLARRLREGAR